MQRLKLSVSLLLISIALMFYGERWIKVSSAGRNFAGNGSLSAPKGVSASDRDYADKVGVMWNAVRGAVRYRIFRAIGSDPAASVDVGNTPANYFFDNTAVPDQTYFYWVRAENTTSN